MTTRTTRSQVDQTYYQIRHAFETLISEEPGSPVDFELPEHVMRQGALHFTQIKRNIYVTKKRKRIEDDGIFCSCTSSPGNSAVCDGDCHCGLLFSCCSSSCKCGEACRNKPFQHRTTKKLKLVQTLYCGVGLTADEDIKEGEFVIEYVGEVIDDKTCEERLWRMKYRGDTNFYLCEVNHDMVIDATDKGNKSRFMNHSCEPNTEMQKWRVEGETRIGIFAIRDIEKGEHLTYDYQFVQFGADQVCHCGAKGCRRKLGNKLGTECLSDGSPSKKRHTGHLMDDDDQRKNVLQNCIGRVVRIWHSHNKRNYGAVILDYDSTSRKHQIFDQDGQIQLIDLSMEEWELL